MASNFDILSPSKIDTSKLTFVVGTAKSGRNPPINWKLEGKNIQVRLPPKIKIPGGIWVRADQQTGVNTYTMSIPLDNCDKFGKDRSTDGSETGALYNFLLDLENLVIQQAFDNSAKWFGKKRSLEALRDSFSKIVSVSADTVNGEKVPNGKYSPSFRVKIPVYDGSVKSDIADGSGNPIYATPDSIVTVFPKGVSASLVISGNVYTMSGGGFGVTWKLTFARVYPQSRVTAKDVFKDETPEDEEEEDAPAEAPAETPVEEPVQAAPPVEEKTTSRRKKAAGAPA